MLTAIASPCLKGEPQRTASGITQGPEVGVPGHPGVNAQGLVEQVLNSGQDNVTILGQHMEDNLVSETTKTLDYAGLVNLQKLVVNYKL